MKALFSSHNLIDTHHLKNLLQSAGIRCRIMNEELARLAGEVPFPECAMQLVIEREADQVAAESIVGEFLHPRTRTRQSWRCSVCAETIEDQFTACWKCGTDRNVGTSSIA